MPIVIHFTHLPCTYFLFHVFCISTACVYCTTHTLVRITIAKRIYSIHSRQTQGTKSSSCCNWCYTYMNMGSDGKNGWYTDYCICVKCCETLKPIYKDSSTLFTAFSASEGQKGVLFHYFILIYCIVKLYTLFTAFSFLFLRSRKLGLRKHFTKENVSIYFQPRIRPGELFYFQKNTQ